MYNTYALQILREKGQGAHQPCPPKSMLETN
jgi:hypothetical protein